MKLSKSVIGAWVVFTSVGVFENKTDGSIVLKSSVGTVETGRIVAGVGAKVVMSTGAVLNVALSCESVGAAVIDTSDGVGKDEKTSRVGEIVPTGTEDSNIAVGGEMVGKSVFSPVDGIFEWANVGVEDFISDGLPALREGFCEAVIGDINGEPIEGSEGESLV